MSRLNTPLPLQKTTSSQIEAKKQAPSPTLRRSLREQRKGISTAQREQFDRSINQSLLKSGILLRSSSIASYLANDGEPSVNLIIQTCATIKRTHYLPVLKKHSLQFVRYSWGDELINNSFNIAEPLTTEKLPPKLLSTILIPLVGFDREGHRLGMGGGYYDRTLNFMLQKSCQKKPLLIGVGYSLQKVNHIQAQPWDVPLDAIVTECGLACFSTKAQSLLHGF